MNDPSRFPKTISAFFRYPETDSANSNPLSGGKIRFGVTEPSITSPTAFILICDRIFFVGITVTAKSVITIAFLKLPSCNNIEKLD